MRGTMIALASSQDSSRLSLSQTTTTRGAYGILVIGRNDSE